MNGETVTRTSSGPVLHDGARTPPSECPRGRTDCYPLSRVASHAYVSFMCCGETRAAPVPTDVLRLCIKSTHATGVDVMVNVDERDAIDTSCVLLGGLSSLAQERAMQALSALPKEPKDG